MSFRKEVVNKVIDPSFEFNGAITTHHTGTSANGAVSPTWARVTTDASDRSASCEAGCTVSSAPATIGIRQYLGDAGYCHGEDHISAGASFNLITAPSSLGNNTFRLYVQFYKQDRATFSSTASVTAATAVPAAFSSWQRLQGIVNVPSDAYWFVIGAEVTSTVGAAGGITCRFDAFMGALHDTIVPYFDGTTQGAAWDGIAELSTAWRWDYDLAVPIGDEMYEWFAPYVDTFGDPNGDLLNMCRGFGTMLQPTDDIARDGDNGEPGYSQVLDLDRAKPDWLPWLGQWVGYRVPERSPTQDRELYTDTERQHIITRSSHRRGTTARLVEEVQSYLNDPKQVFVQQRTTTAHRMTLFYYTAQIAVGNSAAIIAAAAQAQKAKGLILTITPLSGGDWSTLIANQATWTIVTTKFVNWSEVISNPAKP